MGLTSLSLDRKYTHFSVLSSPSLKRRKIINIHFLLLLFRHFAYISVFHDLFSARCTVADLIRSPTIQKHSYNKKHSAVLRSVKSIILVRSKTVVGNIDVKRHFLTIAENNKCKSPRFAKEKITFCVHTSLAVNSTITSSGELLNRIGKTLLPTPRLTIMVVPSDVKIPASYFGKKPCPGA